MASSGQQSREPSEREAVNARDDRESVHRSRARIVAAGDEARRRLQRDVHDGAQQRLVHTILSLKLALAKAEPGHPLTSLIEEALVNAEEANRQLRDIVRGILPSALTHGGLSAGIASFVTDIDLPVDLSLRLPRLPPGVEATGYFTIAEALTNAAKHSQASRVSVRGEIPPNGKELILTISDDGVGGVDLSRGSGLIGLMDRVEAGGGSLTVESRAGRGTVLTACIPLQGEPVG